VKLEGIKVLDLSMFLPGPHLTMMMADHGADVIRVESKEGEPTRALGKWHEDVTVWFRNTHRNKRSVVLDLKHPAGVEAFLALAAQADVIVEAFRVGVVDRLGVGYEAVRRVNPGIVYCSISAFGQKGPNARRVAHDLSIEAESGLVSLNRGRDGEPVIPFIPAADVTGSMMGMAGILMALLRRERTGEGDYVDISMQDSLMSWLVNVISPVFAERRDLIPDEERSLGGAAFYNIYRCADGQYMTLGGSEMKFVGNLLGALGRPDLVELCRLPPGRGQDPVRDFLTERFAEHPLSHWEAFLSRLDVCWAPVRGIREAIESEHVKARGMRLEFPGGDLHLGIPIQFAREPGQVVPRPPALGEHTDDALREVGYSIERIEELRRQGAIGP
jgi:crotonobetainyl-CoA:carnitine CoA-transferase CaiB-like acyl-CoA transferase